jgi:hypothetical protein
VGRREKEIELSVRQREILNNAMLVAGKKFGINTAEREDKKFIGRYELAQLLEEDTLRAARLDVAESHHLAWILSCICGVRPSTLGTSKGKKDGKDFPRWSDVTIKRGPMSGSFSIDVNFRLLKNENSEDDLQEEQPWNLQLTHRPSVISYLFHLPTDY